jgi:hypothetical protein
MHRKVRSLQHSCRGCCPAHLPQLLYTNCWRPELLPQLLLLLVVVLSKLAYAVMQLPMPMPLQLPTPAA